MAAINSRAEPSWMVSPVSERLLLLHSLSQAAPAGQHLPLHLPKSLTSGIFSCRQSLVLPRFMVMYSWWRHTLGVIFMAPNFPHSIFDPLSWTGTQWIVDKVMIEHSLHSVLICDIHTARFPLDCSQAAVCPCTLFRVRCSPHSEGCVLLAVQKCHLCSTKNSCWICKSCAKLCTSCTGLRNFSKVLRLEDSVLKLECSANHKNAL